MKNAKPLHSRLCVRQKGHNYNKMQKKGMRHITNKSDRLSGVVCDLTSNAKHLYVL